MVVAMGKDPLAAAEPRREVVQFGRDRTAINSWRDGLRTDCGELLELPAKKPFVVRDTRRDTVRGSRFVPAR